LKSNNILHIIYIMQRRYDDDNQIRPDQESHPKPRALSWPADQDKIGEVSEITLFRMDHMLSKSVTMQGQNFHYCVREVEPEVGSTPH
jgi:hypothetical protein